jgi:hypothetical protein
VTAALQKLQQRREAQILGLGGLALEMHQQGEIDEPLLMDSAAKVAEVEREIEKLKQAPAQSARDGQKDANRSR